MKNDIEVVLAVGMGSVIALLMKGENIDPLQFAIIAFDDDFIEQFPSVLTSSIRIPFVREQVILKKEILIVPVPYQNHIRLFPEIMSYRGLIITAITATSLKIAALHRSLELF